MVSLRLIKGWFQKRAAHILLDARPRPRQKADMSTIAEKQIEDYFPDIRSFNPARVAEGIELGRRSAPLDLNAFPSDQVDAFKTDFETYLWLRSARLGFDRDDVRVFLSEWEDGLWTEYVNRAYILEHLKKTGNEEKTHYYAGDLMEQIFREFFARQTLVHDLGLVKRALEASKSLATDLLLVYPAHKLQLVLRLRTFKLILMGAGLGALWVFNPFKTAVSSQLNTIRADNLRATAKDFYLKNLHVCNPEDPASIERYAAENPQEVERFKEFGWDDQKRLACVYAVFKGMWGGYYWDGNEFLREDLEEGRNKMVWNTLHYPVDFISYATSHYSQFALARGQLRGLDKEKAGDADYKKYALIKKKLLNASILNAQDLLDIEKKEKGYALFINKLDKLEKTKFLSAEEMRIFKKGQSLALIYHQTTVAMEQSRLLAASNLALWRVNELCFSEFFHNPKSREFQVIYDKLVVEIGANVMQEELGEEMAKILQTLTGIKPDPHKLIIQGFSKDSKTP